MNEGKYLVFDVVDEVGLLTLNNGPNNILGIEFYTELAEFQQIIGMYDIRALVINANGKHFSAGVNLKELRDVVNSDFILQNLPWLQKIYGHWQDLSIPVIAAVQGLCIGSGVELILGCDMRISSASAKYSLPEVSFGLAPDMGGTTRLARLVGASQAKRLIMGCVQIDAAEALRIGLVDEVVPDDQLYHHALALAQKMASMPAAAMAFAKKGINTACESGTNAGLMFEQAQSAYCCGTNEQKQRIDAFFKK